MDKQINIDNNDINLLNQIENGRVVNINTTTYKSFNLFKDSDKTDNIKCNALNGIQELSKLSMLYFSKENIQRLQNLIRYTVYNQSKNNYIIGEQSKIDLEIIMRSIYLQHSVNLDYYYKEQIEYMNNLVLNNTVPTILSEIKQYIGYIENVEKLPIPLELPENLSSAGTRTLQSVTTTF